MSQAEKWIFDQVQNLRPLAITVLYFKRLFRGVILIIITMRKADRAQSTNNNKYTTIQIFMRSHRAL